MRYFTRSMWHALQCPGEEYNETHSKWEQAFREYSQQLSAIRSHLDDEAFAFFSEADVHDAELLELRIVDGSRPAPLSAPACPWETPVDYPVKVELSLLDALDQFVWHVSYSALRRVVVDFPGDETLFYQAGEGFGDLGYHELTDAGNGFLRHEILYASGSVLAVEFREVAVIRTPARGALEPA